MTFPPVTPPKRKHLRSVNYFALAVLYLALVNLARAWIALGGQPYLRTLPLRMPLVYLAVCGLLWGIVFGVAAAGVWRLWPWARVLLLGAIIVYQVHIWINHLVLDTSTYARGIWAFDAGISAAWVIFVWGFLFLPGIRRAFSSETARAGSDAD